MKRSMAVALVFALLIWNVVLAENLAPEKTKLAHAKALFVRYVTLGHTFDPAVADLYSDSAVIRNKRLYPTGQERILTMPAPQYKAFIRQAMQLAKDRGDISTYSEVKYTVEGAGVRITATRFSELKRYSSPVSLLVGPAEGKAWLILEELSESRPYGT